MNSERVLWIAILTLVLITGFLVGRRFLIQPTEIGKGSFRQRFWASRQLDLAVQVGLIVVGALGIVALLPRSGENDA